MCQPYTILENLPCYYSTTATATTALKIYSTTSGLPASTLLLLLLRLRLLLLTATTTTTTTTNTTTTAAAALPVLKHCKCKQTAPKHECPGVRSQAGRPLEYTLQEACELWIEKVCFSTLWTRMPTCIFSVFNSRFLF